MANASQTARRESLHQVFLVLPSSLPAPKHALRRTAQLHKIPREAPLARKLVFFIRIFVRLHIREGARSAHARARFSAASAASYTIQQHRPMQGLNGRAEIRHIRLHADGSNQPRRRVLVSSRADRRLRRHRHPVLASRRSSKRSPSRRTPRRFCTFSWQSHRSRKPQSSPPKPTPRTPQSVTPTTLVGRAEITDTPGADRTDSLSMITDYVPGAYVTHDQLHIRGGHQVTWLLDGVPIPNTNIASNVGPQIDPKDIDYLEIQRGAYAAAYGDRTYGVFNVVPRSGFERNNEADLIVSFGNWYQTNDQLNLGGHTEKFAYYVSLTGNRSNLGLQTPIGQVFHDAENGVGGFGSFIFNLTPKDQFRVVTSLRRDYYQIPYDPNPNPDYDFERPSRRCGTKWTAWRPFHGCTHSIRVRCSRSRPSTITTAPTTAPTRMTRRQRPPTIAAAITPAGRCCVSALRHVRSQQFPGRRIRVRSSATANWLRLAIQRRTAAAITPIASPGIELRQRDFRLCRRSLQRHVMAHADGGHAPDALLGRHFRIEDINPRFGVPRSACRRRKSCSVHSYRALLPAADAHVAHRNAARRDRELRSAHVRSAARRARRGASVRRHDSLPRVDARCGHV